MSGIRRIIAVRWTAPVLLILILIDAAALPSSAFPGQLRRSLESGTHCYFPWQLSITRDGSTLKLAPSAGSKADVNATLDVRLPQSSFWWPTSVEYSTFIGDWNADGSMLSPGDHAQVVSIAVAYFESLPGSSESKYLHLLKTRGEGRFVIPLPLGYLHNALALLCFVTFLASARVEVSRWIAARRRAAARARGVCARCGYDRHGIAADAKCPECGTAPQSRP